MRAYAHGLTMAVACVAFSLVFVPAIAYADEVPCMNEGDNASSITQTAGAEIPDENAGGEQDSSADALQAGNDVDSVEGKPIADAAEEPELPSSSSQSISVGQQPQTPNLLETTPELTSTPGNELDAQSDLADRTVDSDATAGCIDNAPASKGTLTAPESQQPALTGVGDENEAARPQTIIAIDYEPPAPGCVAIFLARVFGLSEAERTDVWYEWQMSTDDSVTWTTISGPGTNADDHKAQLYVPTVKRSDSSSESSSSDQIPVLTLIRVIAHASDGRTAISDPVMLTTQSDELDDDQADDPILLTTPSDECSEEAPIESQDPDQIESQDPDHEEAMDDTGESQSALEAHAGVSAIYGAPSAPDRNASSALPSTGDAVPFAIPTALAAIAALAACVSLIVRRRIDAMA